MVYHEICHLEICLSSDVALWHVREELSDVVLKVGANWLPVKVVPGSLFCGIGSNQSSAGLWYATRLSFRLSGSSAAMQCFLIRYSNKRLIAKYIDGNNEVRIAGSPEYPLYLLYSVLDNFTGYECQLTGDTIMLPSFYV
jgi:hypothetical protein